MRRKAQLGLAAAPALIASAHHAIMCQSLLQKEQESLEKAEEGRGGKVDNKGPSKGDKVEPGCCAGGTHAPYQGDAIELCDLKLYSREGTYAPHTRCTLSMS